MTDQVFPAGWYDDPYGQQEQRFYDGVEWTDRVASAGVEQSAEPVDRTSAPTVDDTAFRTTFQAPVSQPQEHQAPDRPTPGAETTRLSAREADEKRKNRVELLAAIIIGVAAVLTALATFQGGEIDGDVSRGHVEAVSLALIANDAYNDANAQQAIERDWIFGWITEFENENPAALYLEEAMPEEVFALADEWYYAPDDTLDPFSPAAIATYAAHQDLQSTELILTGDAHFIAASCAIFRAQVAEAQGENFGLSTVFLAISLVVGGIAALLRGKGAQIIVLVVSTLSLLMGAGVLALANDVTEARTTAAESFFAFEVDPAPRGADALALADEKCPG